MFIQFCAEIVYAGIIRCNILRKVRFQKRETTKQDRQAQTSFVALSKEVKLSQPSLLRGLLASRFGIKLGGQ